MEKTDKTVAYLCDGNKPECKFFEEINKEKFDLVAARTVNFRGQEIPTYHTLWVKEQRIKKTLKILKGLNILLFVLVILNFLMTLMQ